MENGTITNSQITASGYISATYQPAYARLNRYDEGVKQGWIPSSYTSTNQWLLIDLHRQTLITGIVMQGQYRGSYSSPHWTRTYRVLKSLDNTNWQYVTDENAVTEVRFMPFAIARVLQLCFSLNYILGNHGNKQSF